MKSLINHIIKISFFVLTAFIILNAQNDTTITSFEDEELFKMQKSPWGAVLRSAIIPGWGQLYNESYWKIPIVIGVSGLLVYNWIEVNNEYHKYRTRYTQDLNTQTLRIREFYRDQRDMFAIYIALTYLLNMVDAYVDAHLFDFDVTEEPITKSPQINFKFRF